jgi:hypothetical protein
VSALAAIDCDLRRIHMWMDGPVASNSPTLAPVFSALAGKAGVVLFEVASALDYTDNKGIAHNKRRWTIWNIAQATRLTEWARGTDLQVLVAPSHVWTKRHTCEVRHKLCQATARTKDLRECQSMLWFYQHAPADWVPLDDFLAAI